MRESAFCLALNGADSSIFFPSSLPQRTLLDIRLRQLDSNGDLLSRHQLSDDLLLLFNDLRNFHPVGYQSVASDQPEADEESREPIQLTPTIESTVTLAYRRMKSKRDPLPRPTASPAGEKENQCRLDVIWCNDLQQASFRFQHAETWTSGAIIIFITRLPSGLYFLKAATADHSAPIGPVSDWILASDTILAHVLRQQGIATIVDRFVEDEGFVFPHVARKRVIQRLSEVKRDACESARLFVN